MIHSYKQCRLKFAKFYILSPNVKFTLEDVYKFNVSFSITVTFPMRGPCITGYCVRDAN